ncbi:MAG: ABC transporter permease subunit [Acidaminobacteraceae bacterium]
MKVLIQKEIRDILKNKLFLITTLLLFILSIVAVVLGAIQIRATMMEYNTSIVYLTTLGKTALPDLPNINPLAISKGYVNYLGMIGALLAIILGNYTIVKEREQGTLRLILSRGVFRDKLLGSKIIGNVIVMSGISFLLSVITVSTIYLIGQASLNSDNLTRLSLFFIMSLLYMFFFYILSLALTLITNKGNKALLLAVIIWIVLAFILPQIGDTMDLDNQLPGGFFASMGVTKTQADQVLSQFNTYEFIRNGIEELSPQKHFERMSYALLNIKPGFDDQVAFQVIGTKWIDLVGVLTPSIILLFVSYGVFLRKEDIY